MREQVQIPSPHLLRSLMQTKVGKTSVIFLKRPRTKIAWSSACGATGRWALGGATYLERSLVICFWMIYWDPGSIPVCFLSTVRWAVLLYCMPPAMMSCLKVKSPSNHGLKPLNPWCSRVFPHHDRKLTNILNHGCFGRNQLSKAWLESQRSWKHRGEGNECYLKHRVPRQTFLLSPPLPNSVLHNLPDAVTL